MFKLTNINQRTKQTFLSEGASKRQTEKRHPLKALNKRTTHTGTQKTTHYSIQSLAKTAC